MTLTIEFSAPFRIFPWIDILWESQEEGGDKGLSFGWGPLQVHLTNFSPIATANRMYHVCCAVVNDERKMRRLEDIVTDENFTPETTNRLVWEVMRS